MGLINKVLVAGAISLGSWGSYEMFDHGREMVNLTKEYGIERSVCKKVTEDRLLKIPGYEAEREGERAGAVLIALAGLSFFGYGIRKLD